MLEPREPAKPAKPTKDKQTAVEGVGCGSICGPLGAPHATTETDRPRPSFGARSLLHQERPHAVIKFADLPCSPLLPSSAFLPPVTMSESGFIAGLH
jgi:hypothetical protein